MSTLTRNEVEELALLARLHLEPDEVDQLQLELVAILEHFDALAAIDTTDVEPMTHAVPIPLPLRPDVVEPSLSTADALAAVPRRDGELIVVPAIIPGAES